MSVLHRQRPPARPAKAGWVPGREGHGDTLACDRCRGEGGRSRGRPPGRPEGRRRHDTQRRRPDPTSGLELADALGVSHVAARALLTRARESLRQALADERRAEKEREAALDARYAAQASVVDPRRTSPNHSDDSNGIDR